ISLKCYDLRFFLSLFPVCLATWANAQNGRGPRQDSSNHGWDIRLAVPGEPGNDYPVLGNIPRTSFSCAGKLPGYYADLETNCQAFRVCTSGSTYGFQSFLCPNGTLFNQAVFVCDWWMNVNCQKSEELFSNNNDKFGNLKLGPQLMKDIKKMITHTMRNPYDKSVMKSNLVVMQEYKPPFGQMLPNGALIAGPDRIPNSVYVPAKQIQPNFNYNNNNIFAASTPSPTYVPPPFNSLSLSQRDAEVFQRQRQNGQYRQSGKLQSTQSSGHISNGHTIQYTSQNTGYNNNQYGQRQTNFERTQNNNVQHIRGQQSAQYNDNRSQLNNGKRAEFGISFAKQQYNYPNPNQAYTNHHLPLSNENGQSEAKQNLVSDEVPATIVTKTLTFNRIVEPKPGSPKSRITVKTWIVKPSKAAKLIADPTPYAYDRPSTRPAAKIIANPTPYVYNTPTAQAAKLVSEPEGYAYNKPTIAAKQIATTPSRLYINPTLPPPPPTLSRLYLNPSTAPPTIASRLYIPPTTYKPAAKLYIPPSQSNLILSRQYLAPSALQQPAYYQSEQLRASPTSPAPVYAAPPSDNPSFSLTKHSRINANHNNLTFADILTKEKLDITVNDIVSDTSSVLKTASPPTFGQLRQDKTVDYVDENYLPPDNSESDEKLTPQSPTVPATSARLVAPDLSRDLEPPFENYNNVQNTNRLATLPYFKEPGTGTNTIERTVSLKISIPEKVASYLFKSRNESDYDKLEILNTGSSNYLVLTNNLLNKNTGARFIPIGRLIADDKSNISDSQALVFSLLADSINAAKEYSKITKENIVTTTPAQFQNIDNEELSHITNKISQLTALQYSGNQNNNYANTVSTSQTRTRNSNQHQSAKYTAQHNGYPQNHQVQQQNAQINVLPQHTSHGYPAQYQSGNLVSLPLNNQNVYSGQLYKLPVPDVTNHIYNADSENVIQSNVRQNFEVAHLNAGNDNSGNNLSKQQSAEVEIVRSQTLPLPAKLQLEPSNDAESFNSQEHSTHNLIGNFFNNNNGISAQLQDKIVGTIPHPLEENKFVTYKKDQTYLVYTKVNSNSQAQHHKNQNQQNAKVIQNPLIFQFVPSVSYQLEDEKEQQKILNAFNIDDYGNPKKSNHQEQNRHDGILTSDVDFAVEHPTAAKLVDGQYNEVNTLYRGPSSYSAPQASVGSLETVQNSARLELEEKGYARVTPDNPFTY
ncbi:uncharacterized protein LOC113230929, partial [Hyposmocoma kahamanoa]|uniref:uncharacterized protein LOC113230929 n=1 Tax=Hyposmocoma kahamanoa TaxID=1477025 RepID=UPI000E6D5DEC